MAELEAQVADQAAPEDRSTRRGLLRLAGAAVVGGAVSLIGADSAAAADLALGTANDAGALPTQLTSTAAGEGEATLGVGNTGGGGGIATGTTGSAIALHASVLSAVDAVAVLGYVSGTGYGVMAAGGSAQLYLQPNSGSVAPAAGFHRLGEILVNNGGAFLCVTEGTPGVWRKLGGTASAGAFHAITPTRVYDSRAAAPTPGLLATGSNRLVSVADGRDNAGNVTTPNLVPAGATAVAANVTVTGTVGGFGYLAINPGGNTVEGASTINWSDAGQTLANGVTLTLNNNRQLTVICNGGGSTHFIIDIAGYYL
ncbi:MAG: hypothetical protein K8R99_06335 [Actinomycetia bacterium]|nr:hypothetical protein [Actinomycetes bacterium]